MSTCESFYVQIECDAHSRHRSPTGVYQVQVDGGKPLVHCASAAIQAVMDHAAFVDENTDRIQYKVYQDDGREVCVPCLVTVSDTDQVRYMGRTKEYPDAIQ